MGSIAVKLDEMQSGTPDKSKASRQRVAKAQMTKVDKKHQEERKRSKSRVKEIKKLLKNPDLEKNEVEELENEVRSLENTLAVFEVDDDWFLKLASHDAVGNTY